MPKINLEGETNKRKNVKKDGKKMKEMRKYKSVAIKGLNIKSVTIYMQGFNSLYRKGWG